MEKLLLWVSWIWKTIRQSEYLTVGGDLIFFGDRLCGMPLVRRILWGRIHMMMLMYAMCFSTVSSIIFHQVLDSTELCSSSLVRIYKKYPRELPTTEMNFDSTSA